MAQVGQPRYNRSGGGMKRQATWDALPDIDFFSIPVDDFFDTYVEELGARGLQQDNSVPLTNRPDGSLDSVMEHFPHSGTQQMSGLVAPALAQSVPAMVEPFQGFQGGAQGFTGEGQGLPIDGQGFQQDGLEPLPLGNIVTSGFETHLNHQRSGSGSQGSGNWGATAAGMQHAPGNGHTSHDESPDMDDGVGSPHGGHSGNKRGGNTKTKRNPRQQDQNKQAQQRYRERRKQKFQEMEQTLQSLSGQVEEMHAVQTANAMLQGQTQELESKLHEKDLEIERLRAALAKAGVDQSVVPPCEQMEYAPIKAHECDQYREQKQKSREEEIARFQQEFAANTEQLRNYMEAHGLRSVDPSGEGTPKEVVAHVEELVNQGCQLCQNAMRAEGIKVLALISRDVDQMSNIKCHIERAKWERILDVLRLTQDQAEQLMELRKMHLHNLRALYEDRQRLNLQAMGLMLPKNVPRRQIPDAYTLESKMDCMKITSSYSCAALSNVHLDAILDDIKCNLRKEQRTVMELNYMTMHKVLTPIQAGLFLMEAFPGHCDCLALANILAKKQGAQGGLLDNGCQPTSSEEKSETCCA